MIRTQEMVPDFYIEKSRDFQTLCRMYDFLMNSVKFNTDSIQCLTDTRRAKDTILPLIGDKFGIYDKESYSNRQLLEALPIAIKYKGSLKSIKILINAFLDSLDVFDEAIAMFSNDEETAEEISSVLNRKIYPYSIVIIMSTFPSLTNLHVLDEYMSMVLPTGMVVEYGFGVKKTYLDQFKYKEYTFLYYTGMRTYEEEPMTVPMVGIIKNTHHIIGESVEIGQSEVKNTPVKRAMKNPVDNVYYKYKINLNGVIHYSNSLPGLQCTVDYVYDPDMYTSAFTYAGTDNIRTRREVVGENDLVSKNKYVHKLKHTAVPVPPATDVDVYEVWISTETGDVTYKEKIMYESSGAYTFGALPSKTIRYIEYSFNKTAEFVEGLNESGFDVNAVSIAQIVGKDDIVKG